MLFLFVLAFVDRFVAICLCLFMHTLAVMHTLGVIFPEVYTYTCCFVCLHIEEKFNKINILLEGVLNIVTTGIATGRRTKKKTGF